MLKKIRVAGRTSPLAIAQVHEMMSLLSDVRYEFVPIESYGDKHKEISLLDNAMEDIFTRELDDAVLRGDADCAIHSAKDLPYPLRDGISIAAVTKSADAVIVGCGRWGTLNEFTIALEDGKPIGVLEGSGGSIESIKDIIARSNRGPGNIVYDSDPVKLVEKVFELIQKTKVAKV